MALVYVRTYRDGEQRLEFEGWSSFDDQTAERFPGRARSCLYHTDDGRWVVHWWFTDSDHYDSDLYQFMTAEIAREWLTAMGHSEAAERLIPHLEATDSNELLRERHLLVTPARGGIAAARLAR